MAERVPQVKGVSIMQVRAWIDERFGPGSFLEMARSRDLDWPERVLPGEWYPARTFVHALRRAAERLDDTSLEQLTAELSAINAKKDLTTIHKAFLWVASPRMFLRATPVVWGNYADFATVVDPHNEPGHYRVTLAEIPEDLLDWVAGAWLGFLPPALELAGGVNPQAKILARRPERGELDYEIRYES